jgi:hypothetical protein
MSLIFTRNILCTAVPCQVEMACHVSSSAKLGRRLLVSPLVFVPGFHVCEGLPCLHITHVEHDKRWNELFVGGVPCLFARLDARSSCAVRPELRAVSSCGTLP